MNPQVLEVTSILVASQKKQRFSLGGLGTKSTKSPKLENLV